MVSILFGILAGVLIKSFWYFLAACGLIGIVKGFMNSTRWVKTMGFTPEDMKNPNTSKATAVAFFQGYIVAFVAALAFGGIARLFT